MRRTSRDSKCPPIKPEASQHFPTDLPFPSRGLLRTKAKSESDRSLAVIGARAHCIIRYRTPRTLFPFYEVRTRQLRFQGRGRGRGGRLYRTEEVSKSRDRIADKRNAGVSTSISMLIPHSTLREKRFRDDTRPGEYQRGYKMECESRGVQIIKRTTNK